MKRGEFVMFRTVHFHSVKVLLKAAFLFAMISN